MENDVIILKDGRTPFTHIENPIFGDIRITKTHLLVYIVLCKHADRTGKNSYPSISTIEKESRTSRKTVVKAINDLTEWKYITKEHRYNPINAKEYSSNIYTILPQTRLVEKETEEGG